MDERCGLCLDRLGAIAVVRVAGNADQPEPLPLCQRCGFLPAEQRKHLRNEAMRRMLMRESEASRVRN